jgi:hypothetical protein
VFKSSLPLLPISLDIHAEHYAVTVSGGARN